MFILKIIVLKNGFTKISDVFIIKFNVHYSLPIFTKIKIKSLKCLNRNSRNIF